MSTSPQSLWDKALSTLDEEMRQSLNVTQSTRHEILSMAMAKAEEKRRICIQKRWKVKSRNGQQIILRDVYEKMIGWMRRFIEVGDSAMQYDPGHAALPWAAVRFLLQVTVNDLQLFGAMTEGLETVSYFITRYRVVEQLYLNRSTGVQVQLENAITSIYAGILTYLCKIKTYFQRSSFKRVLGSTFQNNVKEGLTDVIQQDQLASGLLSLADSEHQHGLSRNMLDLKAQLKVLEQPMERLADTASVHNKVLADQTYLQIKRWLSNVHCALHYKNHAESLIAGTGQWLLDDASYRDWKTSSSSSIFLLHGLPGTGKTNLATIIIKESRKSIMKESRKSNPSISIAPRVAFFYSARSAAEPKRSDGREILRSLVKQLCCMEVNGSVGVQESLATKFHNRHSTALREGIDEAMPLEIPACVELIVASINDNPATIVIDGLDECDLYRHQLFVALDTIVALSTGVVKIFLTARSEAKILVYAKAWSRLQLSEDRCRDDIKTFARSRVEELIDTRSLLNGNVSNQLSNDLVNQISNHAQGMFLWVRLQLDALCTLHLESDIRTQMLTISNNTLDEIYEKHWTSLSESGARAYEIAFAAFAWLLCAQEPLSTASLLIAVGEIPTTNNHTLDAISLQSLCRNLLFVNAKTNTFQFAHLSVQEYLLSRPEMALHRCHALVAARCIQICELGCTSEPGTDAPQELLLRYSTIYWARHSHHALHETTPHIQALISEFVFEEAEVSPLFTAWLQSVEHVEKGLANDHLLRKDLGACLNKAQTPLYTACVFGLSGIVKALSLGDSIDWNQRNDEGQTALYLAARCGHSDIVSLLIQQGADPNFVGGKYGTPLQAACFAGHTTIVEKLLQGGADPRIASSLGTALVASLRGGHEAIATILLNKGFEINSQHEFDAALKEISYCGFHRTVQLLTSKYQASFASSIRTPAMERTIAAAALKGRRAIIQRALQKAPVESVTIHAGLHAAALGGQDDIIELLLANNKTLVNINAEGSFGTFLRAASLMGHATTVQLLLDYGADVNIIGTHGDALQAAAWQGHAAVARLLIASGSRPNNYGGHFGTAMQAAAFAGSPSIVEMLLEAGETVYARGPFRDACDAAEQGGHEGVVKLIVDRGYTPHKPVGRGGYN